MLTALSKVFERCHSNQLLFYFEELFSNFLSGFRKGYGCQSALLRMIEDRKSSLDNGNNVGIIAVYLSKTFDSFPHGLLVAKLSLRYPGTRSLAQYIGAQSLATVFIIIFVFPSPRPLPCINNTYLYKEGAG